MDEGKRGMDPADRKVLAVIGAVVAVLAVLVLFGLRWVGGLVGMGSEGVGWQSAFISAVVISTILVIVLAVASGDGMIGEFPLVVVAFFVFTAFFAVSIALIL
jgi:hypothetical protein